MTKNVKKISMIMCCLFAGNLFASAADVGEVAGQADRGEVKGLHEFFTFESTNFDNDIAQQLTLLLGIQHLPYYVVTPPKDQQLKHKAIYISSSDALKLLEKIENRPISEIDSGLLINHPKNFFHRLFVATGHLKINYMEGYSMPDVDESGAILLGMRLDSMHDLIHRINIRDEIARLKCRLTELEATRNQDSGTRD